MLGSVSQEANRITTIVLDVITCLFWNERWCNHDTVEAEGGNQPVESISSRASLLTKIHAIILGGDPLNRPTHTVVRGIDLATKRTSPPRSPSAIAIALRDFATSIPTNACV